MLQGVPSKNTLRFNNLLEGFTGLRKSDVHIVTVYYSERIQIKINKREKAHGVKSKRDEEQEVRACAKAQR